MSQAAKESHVSRKTFHVWKREFHWKERCEDRDNEINEQVHAVMMPQWVSTKTLLIQTLLNLINAAVSSGIAIETPAELTAVSRELRALFGEGRTDVKELPDIIYVLAERTKPDTTE